MWAGVDVGGRRKGFHAAVIDARGVVAGPTRLAGTSEVVEWLGGHAPRVVAVDSPVAAAPAGYRSRAGERELARRVCGIRYTPDLAAMAGNPYYAWIEHGLELYEALAQTPWRVVECFPTASWTRWAGPRAKTARSAWTRTALADLGLARVPARLGQDGRDAIAAAATARQFDVGRTERFGEIVVPVRP